MEISDKTIKNAISRKFIRPLKDGCAYNILKLDNEKRTKHSETISLLKQAYQTLINVEYNLKNYNLVDANILLRSSFEYIMMAMMIQFDENVYKEFITLGIERDRTRVCKIIDKFRTHMNEISESAFKNINREEKLSMLTGLYDKMCDFTHSTLLVSTFIEIRNPKEKEIFQLFMYQNYYFVKMLFFFCLKYFTSDNKHYLELWNVSFTYMFLVANINRKIREYKVDFSKYNDLLYFDKNYKYFERDTKKTEKLKTEVSKFKETIQEREDVFLQKLYEFLK